jgi:hypothetical protein
MYQPLVGRKRRARQQKRSQPKASIKIKLKGHSALRLLSKLGITGEANNAHGT